MWLSILEQFKNPQHDLPKGFGIKLFKKAVRILLDIKNAQRLAAVRQTTYEGLHLLH